MGTITHLDFQLMQERLLLRRKRFAEQPPIPKTAAQLLNEMKSESDLHIKIITACHAKGWYVVHSRMDRPSTQAVGVPDFVIATFKGTYFIEVKRKGGKVTMAQLAAGVMLKHLGRKYALIHSFEEFVDFVK
jgi:hypothetical protein